MFTPVSHCVVYCRLLFYAGHRVKKKNPHVTVNVGALFCKEVGDF
nr:MAG TPA: hypothetical protein [Caudoviricetes sp.]